MAHQSMTTEIQTNRKKNKRKPMEYPTFFNATLPISIALAIRTVAVSYSEYFDERVEFVSPTFSFQHLKDGMAMLKDGLDPFETKNMHFHPLTLHLFQYLHQQFQENFEMFINSFFIAFDVITAWLLASAAEIVARKLNGKNEEECHEIGKLVFYLYAFNPITIVSTAILSLTVIQNLTFAAVFYFFVLDFPAVCAILIGIWSSFTIYPFILISSLIFSANGSKSRVLIYFILAIGSAAFSIFINFLINGRNWNFIEPVYFSILNFSNIQPNVGLYWYFFVQIFEHFRSFYTLSFVVLYFFMPIPLTLMIRKDAILHFTIIGLLVSIFFPYPTLNQVSTLLCILPLHEAYKKHFRYTLLIAGTVVSTIALMPIMWHMWMVSSSGNANFFFAATILYNVALINLVMDMIFVYSRRQIDLEYGDALKKSTKMDFAFY